MKAILSALFVVFASMTSPSMALALSCNVGDSIWSSNSYRETQACTGSGYCTMYDYNPSSGMYEYFYGWHSNCSGERERWVQQYTCKRASDGGLYTVSETGWWSGCNIR